MINKYYITTPIFYVNSVPHIGHTYTTIAADVLARHHRSSGEETIFLTGTDEHGAKIEEKAKEAGTSPQDFADKISTKFKEAWRQLEISNDNFIRTTDVNHIKAVQNALQYMYNKGDIYLDKYEGLYCVGCEQYKTEKDLIDGKCPDHDRAPEIMKEETYMFRLSKYSDELKNFILKDEIKILPVQRKNEILQFFENGLQDISFSRKNVKWGIPLPWDKEHTAYVWADAFLNYLTGLGWAGPNFGSKKVSKFWPAEVQLMSKDILRVHATIWQAMLLSLDLPTSKILFVHGFFLVDGKKMSKSIGNVISPEDLVARYGVDATRYLLMSATSFGRDGDISFERFDDKYNSDLANGLGNLVARVSNMLEKNKIETSLAVKLDLELKKKFDSKISKFKFEEALELVWSILRNADAVLTEKAPWKMKNTDDIEKVLMPIAQSILDMSELLSSFMPDVSNKLKEQFTSKQIKKGTPLFPRIQS